MSELVQDLTWWAAAVGTLSCYSRPVDLCLESV